MSDAALALDGVERTFKQAGNDLHVLRGASVSIRRGETVALVGPSGAGKSTLLHIAGLLERPDGGDVIVGGTSCRRLGDDARTALRRTAIGFVYQFHHLLPEFSALENIVVPQMIAAAAKSAARDRARDLLGMVGLADRAMHRPAKLSGGEQQRVAIVRALANSPDVLIADEPTGNLDQETADRVFALLMQLTQETGVAALVATHNPDLAARMDRKLTLRNGVLEEV
ncbi:MAG: ABC transporter ATP-binding protein [Rhodospirillaceae bacterium]|nr:MAG: ABC transporter ATP-binding protein [Rhodospirillaceae bacterium]